MWKTSDNNIGAIPIFQFQLKRRLSPIITEAGTSLIPLDFASFFSLTELENDVFSGESFRQILGLWNNFEIT